MLDKIIMLHTASTNDRLHCAFSVKQKAASMRLQLAPLTVLNFWPTAQTTNNLGDGRTRFVWHVLEYSKQEFLHAG